MALPRASPSTLTGTRIPTWSPDGARIAFSSRRGAKEDLYVKSLIGPTSEELLLSLSEPVSALDWSRDDRFVLFMGPGLNTHRKTWALPLVGERRPFAVLETPEDMGQARLSPDGQWLAYVEKGGASRSSTRQYPVEVYVRPFPRTASGKWPISIYGGSEPKWRPDGKELFYLSADQRLMAVSVRTTSSFEADPATALFETRAVGVQLGQSRNQYDVAPDGRRFLINMPTNNSSKPITIVVNWPATLPH
jgi:Tol biopolymer transport system component